MAISDIFCGDCLEYVKEFPDGYFDLAVIDPPYGRNEDGGKNRSHFIRQKNGTKIWIDAKYSKERWDKRPERSFFEEMIRVSKNQIIFGCNYFGECNWGPGRIIWDKCNDGSDQSDCEIAYNSQSDRVDIFRYMWRGMMQGKSITEGTVQQGNKALNELRIHPTQKPVALYTWIFMHYAHPGWKIFDPMMGSQSSRIAAYDMNLDYYGCENNTVYFAQGSQRFLEYAAQGSLFYPMPSMLGGADREMD